MDTVKFGDVIGHSPRHPCSCGQIIMVVDFDKVLVNGLVINQNEREALYKPWPTELTLGDLVEQWVLVNRS
jgi:hypothetical protein